MSASSEPLGGPLTIRPGAKLNLTLEVVGRRSDGYHDLATVFQSIDLTDTVEFTSSDTIEIECQAPGIDSESNLARRAAVLLARESGCDRGVHIRLTKRVPIAAGLGGGSADAAAVLVGCDRLWRLGWPIDRLADLAAELGSDCAFFVAGLWMRVNETESIDFGHAGSGTALAGGRGERLSWLPPMVGRDVVLVRPRLVEPPPPDKTRRLYAALTPDDYRDGSRTIALAEAIADGREPEGSWFVNSFERAALQVFPEIAAARHALATAGHCDPVLAGSGPCVYALFAPSDRPGAAEVAGALRATGWEAYSCRTGVPEQADR